MFQGSIQVPGPSTSRVGRKPASGLPVAIIPLAPEHAQRAADIDTELYGDEAYTKRFLLSLIQSPNIDGRMAVNPETGDALGYSIVALENSKDLGSVSHVINVGVCKNAQGQGVGRALMEASLDDVAARGGDPVYLEVEKGNTPAIELYRKLGFKVTGILPKYYATYADPNKDGVLMAKDGQERTAHVLSVPLRERSKSSQTEVF